MLWVIILTLVLLVFIYLLVMPIVLLVDTVNNDYQLKIGMAQANIEGHEKEILRVKLQIILFKFYFYPLRKWTNLKSKKPVKKRVKKRGKINLKRGLRVLKSFRLKSFRVDIDTGDYILNSQLYPVSSLLNFLVGGCHVNFEGKNRLLLKVENRPIRIIRSIVNI